MERRWAFLVQSVDNLNFVCRLPNTVRSIKFTGRIEHFVLVTLMLLFASAANAESQPFAEANVRDIEAFLQEQFQDAEFGLVVGLVDETGSKVISAGRLGNGTSQGIDGNTVFEIGSITKTFTSLLLVDMANSGRAET
jgi:D-alanyl-D-alanine-carboxypeptidase/D-alanyl-D-alanine-endopeptidase